MKCPYCKHESVKDSSFCQSCGKSLNKVTNYLVVAGILAIISSCLLFAYGVIQLTAAWLEFNINNQISLHVGGPLLPYPTYFLSEGIFAIVIFAFGLSAGISAISRKFIRFSVIGTSLMVFSGVLVSLPIESSTSWQAGVPIALLAALGLILIAISKSAKR